MQPFRRGRTIKQHTSAQEFEYLDQVQKSRWLGKVNLLNKVLMLFLDVQASQDYTKKPENTNKN